MSYPGYPPTGYPPFPGYPVSIATYNTKIAYVLELLLNAAVPNLFWHQEPVLL